MRNIKFNTVIQSHDKQDFLFNDFTRPLNIIPDEFYKEGYFDTIYVDDNLTFDLCSLALYQTTEYAELLMIYNNIIDPLILPKDQLLLNKLAEVELNKWLERYSLKGKDYNIPDLRYSAGVWYRFIKNEDAIKLANEITISKIENYNAQIIDLSLKLSKLEEEYESMKDDSTYTLYNRKKLRNEIEDIRNIIFKLQQDIIDVENEKIDEPGTWEPIRKKDLDKLINANQSKFIEKIYNRIYNNLLIKNETYRYIKYPLPQYISKILDYINEGY